MAANFETNGEPEHAIALRDSAEHETGQGYPKTVKAQPVKTREDQAARVSRLIAQIPLSYSNPIDTSNESLGPVA
jgi:hypothetical protein